MVYVDEFRLLVQNRDYAKLLMLWQEYCQGDLIDSPEIIKELELILDIFKKADIPKVIGPHIEALLPHILHIQNKDTRFRLLALLFDIQSTNSKNLAELAKQEIETRFSQTTNFNDKMRLVGLRTNENFQGALTNFLLLNHIQKGNFIYHTAGWGVGEIVDFSFLREQITVSFENLNRGKKDLIFRNCFKTVVPLASDNFLSMRFKNPDILEKQAKENAVEFMYKLLQDLGPKTASEIKDLLCGTVFHEEDYSKWWQQCRAKLKKDPHFEAPDSPKAAFRVREEKASNIDRVQEAFKGKKSAQDILTCAYSLVRDFPDLVKNEQTNQLIRSKIQELLLTKQSQAVIIQAALFLEEYVGGFDAKDILSTIFDKNDAENIELINTIPLIGLQKAYIECLKAKNKNIQTLLLELAIAATSSQFREYILKELTQQNSQGLLEKRLHDFFAYPQSNPETFTWYFQRILQNEFPFFQDKKNRTELFENYLVLLSQIDMKPEYKDLAKKMYNFLTQDRFAIVRQFFKETTADFARELVLLASKCRSLSSHDQKIIASLAEVAHPSLAKEDIEEDDSHIIWTTQEGYNLTQEKIKQIGTVEIVENAREIEVARAHGDLRENAEYKAALEKRSRLQAELKTLSDQFHSARIITKDDINKDIVGIGTTVELTNDSGKKISYTILGPWDADPDRSILSFRTKLVQAMVGKKVGEKFSFKDETFKIASIKSYLE